MKISAIVTTRTALFAALAAITLSGCASAPNQAVDEAQTTETAADSTVAAASEAKKNVTIKASYFANRGANSELSSLLAIADPGHAAVVYVAAPGVNEVQKFVLPTGQFLGTEKALQIDDKNTVDIVLQSTGDIHGIDRETGKNSRYSHHDFKPLPNVDLGVSNIESIATAPREGIASGQDILVVYAENQVRKLALLTLEYSIDGKTNVIRKDLQMPESFDPSKPTTLAVNSADSELWVSNGNRVLILQRDGAFKAEVPSALPGDIKKMGVRACKRGSQTGYWVIAHQAEKGTAFEILDRGSKVSLGSFTVPEAQSIRDMQFVSLQSNFFQNGAVIFVQKDGFGAVDWTKIASELDLRTKCF